MDPTWYRDPGDGDNVESIRKDWELYHYFISQGVAGRWSYVFRPDVKGDDAVWYHQRMNRDGTRGVIIAKHAKTGTGYFLISTPLANNHGDRYVGGGAHRLAQVFTTDAALPDTGIYADPYDGGYRYYGVPGETYGPLNFLYRTTKSEKEESYVTRIEHQGADGRVGTEFFGMAFQAGAEPIEISALGQFDPGGNRGAYSLTLVRAEDKSVVASATLDMSSTYPDALGFKYAKLDKPIRLEPGIDGPVVVFPRGLDPDTTYDVQTCCSELHLKHPGAKLWQTVFRFRASLPAS